MVKHLEDYSKLCQLKFNHLLHVFYMLSQLRFIIGQLSQEINKHIFL